jgi:hypothetical protein
MDYITSYDHGLKGFLIFPYMFFPFGDDSSPEKQAAKHPLPQDRPGKVRRLPQAWLGALFRDEYGHNHVVAEDKNGKDFDQSGEDEIGV